MRRGFTLAELMIAVGIIGIIAAVAIPSITALRPDKTKTAYLKAYDTIAQNIKELSANSRLFPVCQDPETDNSINCSSKPLLNTNAPLLDRYNGFSGNTKLCRLIADSFGVDESCNRSNFEGNTEAFTTQNGMRWWVNTTRVAAGGNATYQTDIYVDVNGVEGPNCIYDAACEHPDRFKFLVAADGDVTPADPMGINYMETRSSLLKKNNDVQGNIIAALPADERTFAYSPCRAVEEDDEEPGGAGAGDGKEDNKIAIIYATTTVSNSFISAISEKPVASPVTITANVNYDESPFAWGDKCNVNASGQCTIGEGQSYCKTLYGMTAHSKDTYAGFKKGDENVHSATVNIQGSDDTYNYVPVSITLVGRDDNHYNVNGEYIPYWYNESHWDELKLPSNLTRYIEN